MGDNPLNNIPSQSSLLASINAVYGALRGVLVPRDAAGVPAAGAADLGSTTVPWDSAYVNQIVVGGSQVDVAALAVGAPIYPFPASDSSFSWPGSQTRCLMLLWSSASGGGGGGSGGGSNQDGNTGQQGGAGVATTVTIDGMTYSSGASPGGRRGRAGLSSGDTAPSYPDAVALSIPGGDGGGGGAGASGGSRGEAGGNGLVTMKYFVHQGLLQGDTMSIVVPTTNGNGGSGGAGTTLTGAAGTAGGAGTSPRVGDSACPSVIARASIHRSLAAARDRLIAASAQAGGCSLARVRRGRKLPFGL